MVGLGAILFCHIIWCLVCLVNSRGDTFSIVFVGLLLEVCVFYPLWVVGPFLGLRSSLPGQLMRFIRVLKSWFYIIMCAAFITIRWSWSASLISKTSILRFLNLMSSHVCLLILLINTMGSLYDTKNVLYWRNIRINWIGRMKGGSRATFAEGRKHLRPVKRQRPFISPRHLVNRLPQ